MRWSGWGRTTYVALVALLFVTAQVQIWVGGTNARGGPLAESALLAGCTLPLVLRSWPLPMFLVVLGSAAGTFLVGSQLGQPWFAVLLALYALGNRSGTAGATVGGLATAGLILWSDLPRLREGADISEVLPAWFVLAGVFAFGRWMRHRSEEQAALRDRTERVERDHEAAVAAVVAQEQSRIARELHDLVAHAMAVIVVQAQAAGRVVRTDPERAHEAMAAIEGVGRAGLVELRRLLDMLDPADPVEDASRPGIAQLDELADRVRRAGVAVDIVVSGTPRSLPPGLDLSVYRIVQEALTNTLKHAGPARSTVAVRYHTDAIEVEINDDGSDPRRSVNGSQVGRGLIGMRERAALFGGTLVAEHRPTGGFRVHARLPVSTT